MGYSIRRATPADDREIVRLLCETLGWSDDERHHDLFQWKHRRNPFGQSFGWVAVEDDEIIGSRTFMRWTWSGGVETVRAVDTATHPRAQGRGVFRALTMHGVEEMKAAGVAWVFNTPNKQSAPGYLSMGWREIGHLPVAVCPGRPYRWSRLLDARKASELWSEPTSTGEDAAVALQNAADIEGLLEHPSPGMRTERSAEFLRWRYCSGPVKYRAFRDGNRGLVLFRLRRRGRATEAVVAEVLGAGRPHVPAGADYAVSMEETRRRWWLPMPGGPLLTWRALAETDPPDPKHWRLTAGDIELF